MVRKKNRSLLPTRPSRAEIDLSAIAYNLSGIRKKIGDATKILAVVKANAYGHGDISVSRYIEKKHTDYFGVAIVEEGITLRMAGITKPVLVFTLPVKNQIDPFFDFGLEPTVSSIEDVENLELSRFRGTGVSPNGLICLKDARQVYIHGSRPLAEVPIFVCVEGSTSRDVLLQSNDTRLSSDAYSLGIDAPAGAVMME